MKAILVVQSEAGQKPTLEFCEVEAPTLESTQLLVSVRAAGVNRIDLARSTAHGGPAAGKPQVAGLEIAGDVIAVGREVTGWEVGDRVMGMTSGAYAEQATIDYRAAMPIPKSFSYDQAASVAIVYPTAHNALVTNGQFAAGKTVLIQGVASAVGIAALQIAKALGAAQVIGVGRPNPKTAKLSELGLDLLLAKETHNIVREVMRATGDKGADVIVDMIGGSALADNIESAALGGRIVNVGWMGGTKGELDLDTLARKRLTLTGVSFRTRTLEQKAELFSKFREEIFPSFEAGTLLPIIHAKYPLADALKVQDEMALDQHLGKFVLNP